MATSDTYTFNPAAATIISQAYLNLGVIDEDEVPTAGMYQKALISLNSLIKEWMATGIHVWTEEEAIVFLQKGQVRYIMGPNSTDHISDANDWLTEELSGSFLAGSTIVTVQGAGVLYTSGQHIGIVLNDNITFWTTINGAPSGDTITLTLPLPGDATQGNDIFVYTTNIVRPLKVPRTRLLYYSGLIETPMLVMSRKEYMDLPNKYNFGTPTQFFYSPQRDYGEFYVWPNPPNSATAARITWYRPLQDFNNQAETADIPQEWINALVWNLSKEMAAGYDVTQMRWSIIQAMAAEKLDMVEGWDREPEPVLFSLGYDETMR